MSLPAPALSVSLPAPPNSCSSAAVPVNVSLFGVPLITIGAAGTSCTARVKLSLTVALLPSVAVNCMEYVPEAVSLGVPLNVRLAAAQTGQPRRALPLAIGRASGRAGGCAYV